MKLTGSWQVERDFVFVEYVCAGKEAVLDLQIQEMAQLEAGTKEERWTLTPSVLSFFLEGKKTSYDEQKELFFVHVNFATSV